VPTTTKGKNYSIDVRLYPVKRGAAGRLHMFRHLPGGQGAWITRYPSGHCTFIVVDDLIGKARSIPGREDGFNFIPNDAYDVDAIRMRMVRHRVPTRHCPVAE
jgi:hypothetical protein